MALRINPEYSETTTDLYNPCVPGSRLGIFADQLPEKLPAEITGLHFHSLFAADSYTLERTLIEIEKRFAPWLRQIQWFNMGGGHHITRNDYDTGHLVSVLKAFKQKYQVEIFMEPGEAVGWQTGYLVSTVQDIIDSKGIKVAMLDTSISAHMPDCIEMPYKPKIMFAEDAVPGKTPWRLGGMTCLAGDFVGEYNFEKDLNVGDTVIFEDMIHYTMVKTTTFNGINLPSIAIWHEDDSLEIVKTFGYQDYKTRLS
jgi:carboxynorspermidine decarboxylase